MNKRISLAVIALVAFICAGLALAADQATPAKTMITPATHKAAGHTAAGHMASMKHATVLTAENLTWTEMPNTGGVQVAKLSGDMMKGAYSCFAKFPAGSTHPLHTHAYDMKCVVVSGTMLYAPENGTEQKLGPGSYLMIPGGLKHASGADAGSECVLFQMQPGKFDLTPAVEKTASQ